jgi:serine/threonine protein kinase
MHVAPEGFTLFPGTDPGSESVFGVQRGGTMYVCKRLHRRALAESWMRERLAAEGALLAALGGRGAPRAVATGEDAHGPWIVMEHVPWRELGSYAARRDARWLEQAARSTMAALAAVHAARIVHADVSPHNVLVADDAGRATLVDFGLARAPLLPPMPPGPFRGTLAFAAPEVARGQPFDERADLFGMAASLLHTWSGEAPRSEGSEAAMLLAAGEQSLASWAERTAGGLPQALADALVACCAFEPRARPSSAAAILAIIDARLGAERGVT